FEVEDIERAQARFEELRPAPLRIPPNAAMRVAGGDALSRAWLARDSAAIRGLAAPDFRYEDRGKRALVSGDIETWIDSIMFWPADTRVEAETTGTLGDRISLEDTRWSGAPDGGAFEIERVTVTEVDPAGRLRAVIRFDPDDRGVASAEALTRFAAGEAAATGGVEPCAAYLRAVASRDWERVRECHAPEAVWVDHRPLGLGTLDLEQWVASLRAIDELSERLSYEILRVLAWNADGLVIAFRRRGTVPDGGGPFEDGFIVVTINAGDRIQRGEVFAEQDAERAVARFEELSAAQTT
ncbi:MAG: nuclear transport factor 2 family protein, partial [Candidatus Binatia bacterium]